MTGKPKSSVKSALTRHIQQVCSLVFSQLGIPGNPIIKVVDCRKDPMQQVTAKMPRLHEFLVMLECTAIHSAISNLTGKLNAPFGKSTCLVTEKGREWLCWYEGDPLPQSEPSQEAPAIPDVSAPYVAYGQPSELKAGTSLPNWLDALLFERMRAVYRPDFQKFEYNLELSDEDLRVYLGTYFPRSYAEVFCIFDHLFENKHIHESILAKQVLTVLDIGCGSGGDLLGFLTAVSKHFTHLRDINIIAVDGHKGALDLLVEIVGAFEAHTHQKVTLKRVQGRIDGPDLPLQEGLSEIDFALSCKAINEVISKGGGKSDKTYYSMLERYASHLHPTGLMMLLDVTTKPAHAEYYPFLLNKQVSDFIRTHPVFRTLLPLPCSFHECDCHEGCFSQRQFYVLCKGKGHVVSRVAFRVIGKRPFVGKINGSKSTTGFIFPGPKPGEEAHHLCHHGQLDRPHVDAYTLTSTP